MKSSTGQKIGLPVDRGRHRSPNFVLLGLDLLTSIGLDLLRRHAKSWTASLKEEVGARRAVLKRQMLDTSKSDRPNSLLPERAQKEGGKLQRKPLCDASINALEKHSQGMESGQMPATGSGIGLLYSLFLSSAYGPSPNSRVTRGHLG